MAYTNESCILDTKAMFLKKENWTSKIFAKMKEHKWISILAISTVIFSVINFIMIYYFMKLLQTL